MYGWLGYLWYCPKTNQRVNGLEVIEKPNVKLRVCLDRRPLNKENKRENLHQAFFGALFYNR